MLTVISRYAIMNSVRISIRIKVVTFARGRMRGKTCKRPHPRVIVADSPDKTGHPVVAMANKRRICAGNSVLSTGIRVISVQRDLGVEMHQK